MLPDAVWTGESDFANHFFVRLHIHFIQIQ